MEKKIKSIDLVFENCEVAVLTPDMIYQVSLDDVVRNIGINWFQYKDGEVHDYLSCSKACVVINQKGLKSECGLHPDYMSLLEERIKGNDITHIDVIYEDGTNEYITVPWLGDSDYNNDAQHNIYTQIGYDDEEGLAVIINQTPLTIGELEEQYGI